MLIEDFCFVRHMVSKIKSICIATGTRAEYGLLRPLIARLKKEAGFDLRLLVTGMHLSPEFGYTYQEIEADGNTADAKIELILSSDTPVGMSKSVGLGIISFADYFSGRRPSLLIVLGDRFEMFSCATAAALAQIPIAHLYGGDTTEGAIDEFIRHSITKMSQLHFVSNKDSRERVIQLGEHPDMVFDVGALGVENALHMPLLSRKTLAESLGLERIGDYALLTFHPVTLEPDSAPKQLLALFAALEAFCGYDFIATKANADSQGRIINTMLEEYAAAHPNFHVYASLGNKRYLSAMKYASFVIGNSSSGLYETPCFGVPCVNIGDRQRGRMRGDNVIDCPPEAAAIAAAIETATSAAFKTIAKAAANPFGQGDTSQRMVAVLKEAFRRGDIEVKKTFYRQDAHL